MLGLTFAQLLFYGKRNIPDIFYGADIIGPDPRIIVLSFVHGAVVSG